MKLRLLMVDDDATLTGVIGRVVELDKDWEFSSAGDYDAGLVRARDFRPDVIVLDYDLGEERRNGFSFLRELRADPLLQHVPVIVFTGTMVRSGDAVEGLDLGADGYLRKPVAPNVLLARARAAALQFQRAYRRG